MELNGLPVTGSWLHYRYGLHPPPGNKLMTSSSRETQPVMSSFTETMKKANIFLNDVVSDNSLPLAKVPGMYRFEFNLEHVADTYLKLDNWGKVSIFIFFNSIVEKINLK